MKVKKQGGGQAYAQVSGLFAARALKLTNEDRGIVLLDESGIPPRPLAAAAELYSAMKPMITSASLNGPVLDDIVSNAFGVDIKHVTAGVGRESKNWVTFNVGEKDNAGRFELEFLDDSPQLTWTSNGKTQKYFLRDLPPEEQNTVGFITSFFDHRKISLVTDDDRTIDLGSCGVPPLILKASVDLCDLFQPMIGRGINTTPLNEAANRALGVSSSSVSGSVGKSPGLMLKINEGEFEGGLLDLSFRQDRPKLTWNFEGHQHEFYLKKTSQ